MKKKLQEYSINQDENYTYAQVKQILRKLHIPIRDFNKWIFGQTCPLIELANKRVEAGVYGWDLNRYIGWKLKGTPTLWD